MITEKMISTVYGIHNCIQNKMHDAVLTYINTVNAEEISEELLNDDVLPQNKMMLSYPEMLKWFIEFCSYVEEETDMPAVISDDIYDKLVAKLVDLGEVQPIGSPISNVVGIGDRKHSFPELRGSLAKVHFIWEKDIPEKDSRKSLEGYLRNVVRQMVAADIPVGKTMVSVDLKFDGVSHIIEGENGEINHILTRGDVGTNTGKELTQTFSRFFPRFGEDPSSIDTDDLVTDMHMGLVPESIWDNDSKYGIKVETYMPTDLYEKFEKETNDKKCNRRSAVVSICNQSPDNITPNIPHNPERVMQSSYLRMQHFQIASEKPIELDKEKESKYWFPIGKINNRYQYLYIENPTEIDLSDIEGTCNTISELKETMKKKAESLKIPIDGIVITLLDSKLVDLLGRKNDKNMFQVAFKFPAGEEKTTIEAVDFQVGPIAGLLTPVARLKPIRINGNKISNVTVSNKAKLERLKLHVGDEVLIRYDIIPSIFKDASCKESNAPLIEFPTHCPICDGDVENERCINPNCPSKLIGHIMNFVEKNRIKGGIGFQTIVDFVNYGFLTSIGDIYRLYQKREELYNLPNYGETSIDSILDGISDARKLLPHEILGAIGIPSIGLKKMEKLCKSLNIIGNLDHLEDLLEPAIQIPGIGEKTAKAAFLGIESKKELIEDICSNVEILPYPKPKKYISAVCFTLVRNENFEEFLEEHNIAVKDSVTSDVRTVIIPNEPVQKPSTKMNKALLNGIEMITISEAMKRWNYDSGRDS